MPTPQMPLTAVDDARVVAPPSMAEVAHEPSHELAAPADDEDDRYSDVPCTD